MNSPVNIIGIGTFFPRLVKRSSDFDCAAAGVDPGWVEECGVDERRWAAPSESIIDLAHQAALRALRHAGVSPREIDRLILVSSTLQPDLIVPGGAPRLQFKLGIERGPAFFLLETCCGALMAMDLAAASIRSGQARTVLVVAAETFSKTYNPSNPQTFKIGMNMGDGAAAVVLSGRADWPDGLVASHLVSSGEFQSGLGMRPDCVERDGVKRIGVFFGFGGAPPSAGGKPLSPDSAMKEIKRFTTSTVPAAIEGALSQAGLARSDIDLFLLHQPSRKFLEGWKREAQIPEEKTLDTLRKLGNLSSVSTLTNLDMAYQQGRLREGATVLLAAVGEGSSWGATIWKWRLPPPGAEHRYLLEEPAATLQDRLVGIERYSMIELWEKHILPGAKESYRHEELFSDFVPSMAVFEGVPLEAAFEFLARTENMALWTLSMRNLRPFRGDVFLADETATPTGKVFVQTLADRQARTIGWNAGHSDPDDLWICYRGLLVDAQAALGRKGTAFFWTNFVHERVKNDPALRMGFKAMFSAHRLEIQNLKSLLEHRLGASQA